MVVKTRKQGNSITITIPSEFTKEDNNLDSDLTNDIFDEYDDIFKALVGN